MGFKEDRKDRWIQSPTEDGGALRCYISFNRGADITRELICAKPDQTSGIATPYDLTSNPAI
jgi:hypothetical protein